LANVIRLVEGPLAPLPCASETQFRQCDECVDVETCGTAIVMRQVRDAIAQILEQTTLATVCDKVDRAVRKRRPPKRKGDAEKHFGSTVTYGRTTQRHKGTKTGEKTGFK